MLNDIKFIFLRKIRRFAFNFFLFLQVFIFFSCQKSQTPQDKPKLVFGTRGNLPRQFEKPRAVAVSPVDSRLVIIDRNGRIQLFDSAGEFIEMWRMPDVEKGTPSGCSINMENQLVIADTHYHRILVTTLEGKEIFRFGSYGKNEGEMVYPTDVVTDSKGNFYVTEYGFTDRVLQFDQEGNYIKEWGSKGSGPGEFERPMSLTLLDDRIYVADSCNHRVQVFDLEGNLVKLFGEIGSEAGQFRYPYDITINSSGEIFICEYGNHRVQKFDSNGEFLKQWGGEPGNQPGQFLSPWGCAYDPRGQLIIADTMNFRIQIF